MYNFDSFVKQIHFLVNINICLLNALPMETDLSIF